MHVTLLQMRLLLPSRTLKEKRAIVKSVLSRSRNRFNVACSESALHDQPAGRLRGNGRLSLGDNVAARIQQGKGLGRVHQGDGGDLDLDAAPDGPAPGKGDQEDDRQRGDDPETPLLPGVVHRGVAPLVDSQAVQVLLCHALSPRLTDSQPAKANTFQIGCEADNAAHSSST